MSNVCRDIQKIERLIRKCVPIPQNIYNIPESSNADEVEQYFPGFLSFTDSTEQQIPRSVDKDRRKMYYSLGKKKRHTIKNQLVANNQGYIVHKAANHKKGRRHDYLCIKI